MFIYTHGVQSTPTTTTLPDSPVWRDEMPKELRPPKPSKEVSVSAGGR